MAVIENKVSLHNKELAMILADLAYHISPEIVKYIATRNNNEYAYFKKIFGERIEIANYLFEGSDCVFPGVKRYIGMRGDKRKYNIEYKAIIDDNTFPRHIWCFLLSGKSYSGPNWKETGLHEFELAHVFSHKESEIDEDGRYFEHIDDDLFPYGEFTSAANVVLLPKGTVRPTDNSTILKSIFYKRYLDLYGETTLGGRNGFKHSSIPEWYTKLSWNTPLLPSDWKKNIDKLLKYRTDRITHILRNSSIIT